MSRLLAWVSVGVMAVGLHLAAISGAGAAAADTDSGSNAGSSSSQSSTATDSDNDSDRASQSAESAATQEPNDTATPPKDHTTREPETGTDADEQTTPATDETDGKGDNAAEVDQTAPEASGPEPAESDTLNGDPAAESAETADTDVSASEPDAATRPESVVDQALTAEPQKLDSNTGASEAATVGIESADAIPTTDATPTTDAVPPTDAVPTTDAPMLTADAIQESAPAVSESLALALAAVEPAATQPPAAAQAPAAQSLVEVIGSLVFAVYDIVLRLFEGPPVLPPGSTVTVRRSTLRFESGREIPANWYFPDDPDPKGLIFLQHGFLAAAPFYSYTAAALAEQTGSIVVATSVTSNPFAADGFSLSGSAYQQAVAGLFTGDRNELTDSASAALGKDVTLPTPFVLTGHSAGGGLALAAASYMDDATRADLAGIVLFDGVANEDVIAVLPNIPDSVPIYQLAAPPYSWNNFGATSDALVAARPGQFNGVQLVGGSHVDSTQGGNLIFQIASYVATGFSKAQNIEAVKILASGWINDMFDGTTNGIYGDPGEAITIPTPAGNATAIVLPPSAAAPSADFAALSTDPPSAA